MPVDRWPELAEDFGDPALPADLRKQVEQRVARLQAESDGPRLWSPRLSSVARWVAAGVGVVLVIAALAIAAHSHREPPASGQQGQVEASVVLLAQQGRYGSGSVVGWRTKQHARVTCGAHPAVTSSVGNNGIRPSDLCRALAYYPAHSTESRCSYGSNIGDILPSRVLITGAINSRPVHLNMGMRCNPPAKLAQMTGLIWATVFGYPNGVKATISENTFRRLTRIAQTEARALGDPKVHSAEVVLTTRRRMNSGLGVGYQASEDQTAKVFVIQLLGTFTCNECSHPAGADAATGTAAQDVLTYGSLTESDFGLTPHAVVMQRMGPIMHLAWKPTASTPHNSATAPPTSVRLVLPDGWNSRSFSGGLGSDPHGLQVLVAANVPLPASVAECEALIPRLGRNRALVRIYDYGGSPLAPRALRVSVIRLGKIRPVTQPNGRVGGFNQSRVSYDGHTLTIDTSFGSSHPSVAVRTQVATLLRRLTTR
jgi:hypothetical protein